MTDGEMPSKGGEMPTAAEIAAAEAAAAEAAAKTTTATVEKTSEKGDAPPTLEEAMAELERTRAKLKETNHESATRRKRLEELEAQETARKTAELSENDKLKLEIKTAKEATAAAQAAAKEKEDKARLALLRATVLAEATEQNVDPSELASVWKDLKDTPSLMTGISDKEGADGEFEGVKAAVEKIVKAHPLWRKPDGGIGTPLPNQSKTGTKLPAEQQKKAQEQTHETLMRDF